MIPWDGDLITQTIAADDGSIRTLSYFRQVLD
jgi:hypothetical protein